MSATTADTPKPLLVYKRIDANRRATRLLMAVFVVALLPVVSVAAVFVFPLIHLMYFSVTPGLAALGHTSLLMLYAGFFLISMVLVTLVLAAMVDRFVSNCDPSFILRFAQAKPVDPSEEPELVQLVDNLCIAAGLPVPRVHVIESASTNAFAVGRSPEDASLVVTRGLVGLLDRRELEGVVAHELSHIGNHDIALNTTLAALISTVSIPLKVLSAPLRIASGISGPVGIIVFATVVLLIFVSGGFLMMWEVITAFIYLMQFNLSEDSLGSWWELYAKLLPLYVMFGAPSAALLIRHGVSHQRAFLADADAALLTRDPEGLALALVKVRAAIGDGPSISEDAAHLYFVDPMPRSWLHVVFPSHPPIVERIDLLARMGAGIPPSTIAAACDAAAKFVLRESDVKQDESSEEAASLPQTLDPSGFDGLTRLYDQPRDGSRVLALLGDHDSIKVEGRQGDYVAITAEDGTPGYVFRPLPSSHSADK